MQYKLALKKGVKFETFFFIFFFFPKMKKVKFHCKLFLGVIIRLVFNYNSHNWDIYDTFLISSNSSMAKSFSIFHSQILVNSNQNPTLIYFSILHVKEVPVKKENNSRIKKQFLLA